MKAKERRLPTTYDPIIYDRNLIRYNNCIQEESLLAIRQKAVFKDNITSKQRQELKSLKEKINSKEIIVTRVDKGSRLVVVDYNTYIEKGTMYIQQEANAYKKSQEIEESIVNKLVKKRNTIVNQLKDVGVISKETATFSIKQVEEILL